MITELGHFALIVAFLVAIVQTTVPLIGAQRRWSGWMAVAEPAATTQFLLTAGAFAALTWASLVVLGGMEFMSSQPRTQMMTEKAISNRWQ